MDKENVSCADWGLPSGNIQRETTYLAIAKEYQKDYEDDIVSCDGRDGKTSGAWKRTERRLCAPV